MTAEQLERLFKMDGKPYLLKYSYRTVLGKSILKKDADALKDLKRAGKIKRIEVTPKYYVYQWIAE